LPGATESSIAQSHAPLSRLLLLLLLLVKMRMLLMMMMMMMIQSVAANGCLLSSG